MTALATKHGVMTALGRRRFEDMVALWTAADQRVEAVLGTDAAEALRRLADTVASQQFLNAYSHRTVPAPTEVQPKPEGSTPTSL